MSDPPSTTSAPGSDRRSAWQGPRSRFVPGNHLMAGFCWASADQSFAPGRRGSASRGATYLHRRVAPTGGGPVRRSRTILSESGQGLDAVQVHRTIDINGRRSPPSEAPTAGLLRLLRKVRKHRARGRHRRKHRTSDRPRRHRQVLPGGGPGGPGAAGRSRITAKRAVQLQHRRPRSIPTSDPGPRTPSTTCSSRRAPQRHRSGGRGRPLAFMWGRTLNNKSSWTQALKQIRCSSLVSDSAPNGSPATSPSTVDVAAGDSALAGEPSRLRALADAMLTASWRTSRTLRSAAPTGGSFSDIYAADEQADHPVDVQRWAQLARSVLEAEGARQRHRGVAAVRGDEVTPS